MPVLPDHHTNGGVGDFKIKQGDTWPPFRARLATGYSMEGLTATAKFVMRKRGSVGAPQISAPATMSDGVAYYWQAGNTDTVGIYDVEWHITLSDGNVHIEPDEGYHKVTIVAGLLT